MTFILLCLALPVISNCALSSPVVQDTSCPLNCLKCSDSTTCTECNQGYRLNEESKECEKIPCSANCQLCDIYDCIQCDDGYYRYWDNNAVGYRCEKCIIAVDHCRLCVSTDADVDCTSCELGYFINSIGNCASCPADCDVCSDSDNCQTCRAGYYTSDQKTCQACDDNCATCSRESTHCTSCKDGFDINENNVCVACPSNCKHCKGNICTECNEHYFSTDGGKQCEECGSHCLQCNDKTTCIECEIHYFNDGSNGCQECSEHCDRCESKTKCVDCIPEYYVTPEDKCSACAPVCHECDGPSENDCLDCDDGYYFSRPNRKCFKCHEGCTKCTGPNDYECSECSSGFFMDKESTGILPGIQGRKCTRCEKGCSKCTDAKQCTTCKPGYYITEHTNKEGIDRDCEACESGCSKCDGGSTKCSECLSNYYISEKYDENGQELVKCTKCPDNCKKCANESGTVKCADCLDGYYKDPTTGVCEQCTYPCSKCSSATVCLSCADGRLLQGNSCDTACSSTCLSCTNTANQCETCYEGYVPSGTTCIQCPSGCRTCEVEGGSSICTSCLNGYYKDGEECHQCSSPCATCFSSNTYNGCYSCEKGYFMNQTFTFPTPYGGQCSECKKKLDHCVECSTECIDDDLDSYETCHNFKCTKCEGGYFVTEENGATICSPCPDNCFECSDSTTCIQCNQGYRLNEESKECEKIPCSANCQLCDTSNCIQCDDGYYKYWDNNAVGYRCEKCIIAVDHCRLCVSTDADVDCTSCELGYFINSIGNCASCPADCDVCSDSDNCQTCRAGYYTSDQKTCQACDDNCATCSRESTHCTSCKDGFDINENNVCVACPSNCKHCKGNICTECNEHYFSTDGGKQCEECGSHCLQCNDKTTCIECEIHYFNDGSNGCQECSEHCDRCESKTKCVDCIPEYYVTPEDKCSACAPVCHECDGPSENDCLDCDDGYYFSRPNRKCFKCHEGCTKCTGPNDYECSECSSGFFMDKESTGILPGIQGRKCTRCEKGCSKCTDAKQCTTCKPGYYITEHTNKEGIDRDCEACESGCSKCDGGSTKCSECLSNYYISEKYDENGQELVKCTKCPDNCKKCANESGTVKCADCLDGYYKDPTTGVCEQCTYPCSKCSSATVCLSCADGRLLQGNSCDTACSSTCLSCTNTANQCETCYEGYVPSGTTCIQCPSGCRTCEVEGGSSICTSCLNGYYKDGEECHQCSSPCATCFSSNTYNGCYSCEKGYFMNQTFTFPTPYGGQCSECKKKLDHCVECSTECIDDDLDSYETCHNFKCTKCEAGYFATEENGAAKCSPCPENCSSCSDSKTCTRCKPGYMLNGTKCEIQNDICQDNYCQFDNSKGTDYVDLILPPKEYTGSSSIPESGGAVRMINTGLTAENSKFSNCASQQGGGAIFIYNKIVNEDTFYTISLKNLEFKNCKAGFGSAVYIYSPLESCNVEIISCIFDSNQIISSSTSKLSGGALYLTAKTAVVLYCDFKNNKGRGGGFKITDDFDLLPENNLRMLHSFGYYNYSKGSVVVSKCSFEISSNSDSSLFYENERPSIKVEISHCSFKGKLAKGAHYINGKSMTNGNHNLLIKSCQFSANQQEAISSKFIKVDLSYDMLNNKFNKVQMTYKLNLVVSLATVVAAIAIIAIVKKRNDNNNNHIESVNENTETVEV